MKLRTSTFILCLVTSGAVAATPTATSPTPPKPARLTKSEMRAALQASAQTQDVIVKTLAQLQKLKANHIAKTKLKTAEDKLVANIYDRLITAIESRYKSGDLADFLNKYSLQMAETEKRNSTNLTAFFSYLGDVVKASKNDRSDLIATIEKYIRSAPVSDPLSAVRFILNNSYSNGANNEFAVGLAREDAVPDSPFVEVKKEDVETILPPPLTPYLLPPQEEEIEVSAATTDVEPKDKENKTNGPVIEKTQQLESPKPSTDTVAPIESPVSNNPSAS